MREGLMFAFDDELTDQPSVSLLRVNDFADAFHLRVGVTWGSGDQSYESAAFRTVMEGEPPASLSLRDEDLLPQISGARVDLSTPGRPIATWDGDTGPADAVRIQFIYGDPIYGIRRWFVALAPGTNEFAFPALPEALAAFATRADTMIAASAEVEAFEASFVDGLDGFSKSVFLDYWWWFYPSEGEFTARFSASDFR